MLRSLRVDFPSRAAAISAVIALVVLGWAAPANAVKRRAFVTSVAGTGDLASWPGVTGATALDRADSICRALAAAATPSPLPNAATYRAWLSTSTTDAFCHAQGLVGKKATGCNGAGQSGGGPWFLANGATNFSGSLLSLVDGGEIYRPISRDENFGALPTDAGERLYWTGTAADGVWTGVDCGGWTNDTPGGPVGTVGDGLATTGLWSRAADSACAGSHRLLCFEPGAGDSARLGWSPAAIAFVSSVAGKGNLSEWPEAGGASGLAAGDAVCETLAAAASLPSPESFVAWLSTASPAVDAVDRLAITGPWKRIDAYTIASNVADLADSTLDTSLHQFENGDYLQADCSSTLACNVWTGTLADGAASNLTCDDWANSSFDVEGTKGSSADGPATNLWTDLGWTSCNASYRLYCLSNVITLFWDGFEITGDSSRWSHSVP